MTGKTSEQAKASSAKAKPAKTKPDTKKDTAKPDAPSTGAALLSGGNPQIAKGHGDAPVQAYIAAMPGWKSAIGHRLDKLITQTIPDVQKAVKWNSPLYGMDDQTWFLGIHCFDTYIKLAFFRGTSLTPMPPVASKTAHARYLHIHADGVFDETQFVDWMRQASGMPGEKM